MAMFNFGLEAWRQDSASFDPGGWFDFDEVLIARPPESTHLALPPLHNLTKLPSELEESPCKMRIEACCDAFWNEVGNAGLGNRYLVLRQVQMQGNGDHEPPRLTSSFEKNRLIAFKRAQSSAANLKRCFQMWLSRLAVYSPSRTEKLCLVTMTKKSDYG